MGKLIFRYGCMNSGKSMWLLATAYNLQERGVPFYVLKSSIDTRDKGIIHSRSLGDRECITVNPNESIKTKFASDPSARDFLLGYKKTYILVDEAQFLTESQVDELAELCDAIDCEIICYGLRTDFKTKLFEGSKRLFEIADAFEEIESTCSCGHKNVVNARIDANGEIVTNGAQIEVGAEDKYVSMCRECYYEKINKI